MHGTDRTAAAISGAAARLAISAVIAYQALLIVLIFLRPDLDPSWHTISEWAIGRYGWVMVLAFLISALSYGALFVAIRSQVRGLAGKVGLGILLICVVGTAGVGVFVTDPMPLTPAKGLSVSGTLHVVFGGSALMLLPFAALLVNLSLAFGNRAWAPARRALLWTAPVPLAGLVGFVVHLAVVVMPMGEEAYGPGVPLGWPPRFLFVSYMVWLVTLAAWAISLRRRQVGSSKSGPGPRHGSTGAPFRGPESTQGAER